MARSGPGPTSFGQRELEAEQRRQSILTDLGSQQESLTGRITELHTQETDLRDKLKAFLSDQLSKLDDARN